MHQPTTYRFRCASATDAASANSLKLKQQLAIVQLISAASKAAVCSVKVLQKLVAYSFDPLTACDYNFFFMHRLMCT